MFTPLGTDFRIEVFVLMVLYWPCSKTVHNRTLPPELWHQILDYLCHSNGDTFLDYNNTRDYVCTLSPVLDVFVKSTPAFWTRLHLDCSMTLPQVQRHLRYLPPTMPIDVSLTFDPDGTWIVDSTGVKRPICEWDLPHYVGVAIQCLIAIRPTVFLWKRVCIYSTTGVFMSSILSVFQDIPAPMIQSLDIACPPYRLHRRCDYLFVNPLHIFADAVPNLTSICLASAALPWGSPAYFGRILVAKFGAVPYVGWPSVSQFIETLAVSSNITHLEFSGGGLKPGTALPDFPSFTMASLDSLTVVVPL
ncbi:hypothetical protein B0H13DRAFT_2393788 [Mycena leptocephala]|nr:hypothetical protein B0H13DRAFT_2393788 [Mycena leptocephala]